MKSIQQSLAVSAIMLFGANALEASMDLTREAPEVSQDEGTTVTLG